MQVATTAPREFQAHDARAWVLDGRPLVQVRFRSAVNPLKRSWGLWDYETDEPTFVAGMFRAGVTIHQAASYLGFDSNSAPILIGDVSGGERLSTDRLPADLIEELQPPPGGTDGLYRGSK
jgi:hypothetical protein